MEIDAELILGELKEDKSPRTQASLDKLNELLKTRFETGEHDFSIATIGKASKETGGVGVVSIRNKSGEHFRRLIEAWAAKADTTLKKPPVPHSRQRQISTDKKLLEQLDDPVLRTLFGQVIAERNKLKNENHTLKKLEEITIDLRPKRAIAPQEAMPSFNGVLLPIEIEALQKAIADSFFQQHFWTVDKENGGVKDENDRMLYQAGYVTAIEKILEQLLTVKTISAKS